MNELRELQNEVFGIARSIKGIQNDLSTRHRARAKGKAIKVALKLHGLGYAMTNVQNLITGGY